MKDLTVHPGITIRQAMKTLIKTAEKCLLVVDSKQQLLGTLTDGDLRRSILVGTDVNSSIEGSYCKEPHYLTRGHFTPDEAGEIMTSNKIELLPIVDNQKVVVNFTTWEKIFGKIDNKEKQVLDVPVVIMAGGKGTRLEPFTKVLPKPLVPINDKPVIEHIIEQFTVLGCKDFYLTVNFKSRIMKAYFEELQPEYRVDYIKEEIPQGTAGSLHYLVNKFKKPFFVTNCDIIIKAEYDDLYDFHIEGGYDITLVASMKAYTIPYGTCVLNDDGHLKKIHEKPQYDLMINTGLYVVNPSVLQLIPADKMYHITDLIEDIKRRNGGKVGVYPIDDENWIDIGQWSEYKKTVAGF